MTRESGIHLGQASSIAGLYQALMIKGVEVCSLPDFEDNTKTPFNCKD
jgi:hypothetical protein